METSTNKIVQAWNAWCAQYGYQPISATSEIVEHFRGILPFGSKDTVCIDGMHFRCSLYGWADDVVEESGIIMCRVFDTKSGKFVKMKLTKFVSRTIDCVFRSLPEYPEQVRVFLREHCCRCAAAELLNAKYTLHVDNNFSRIYDSRYCADFGSCMKDKGFEVFYECVRGAKAAYLTDDFGVIVARAILFCYTVLEDSGDVIRVLERQYADHKDTRLMQVLVSKLISGGHIDAYREIGSGYSDTMDFVDIHGKKIESVMYIEHGWNHDSYIPYMDSFAYYDDIHEGILYNHGPYMDVLKETDGTVKRTESGYYTFNEVVEVQTLSGDVLEYEIDDGNIVEINGNYYLLEETAECPECGELYFTGASCYSAITDEEYCCDTCRVSAESTYADEEGLFYSELTEQLYESEEEMYDDEFDYKKRNWFHNPLGTDSSFRPNFSSAKNHFQDKVELLNREGKFVMNYDEIVERMSNHEYLTRDDVKIAGIEEGYIPVFILIERYLDRPLYVHDRYNSKYRFNQILSMGLRFNAANTGTTRTCHVYKNMMNDFIRIDELPERFVIIDGAAYETLNGEVVDWTWSDEMMTNYDTLFYVK